MGPFIATFFITLLVLVMQFFWLYIDDFVGKGIDTKVIFEFILYQSAVFIDTFYAAAFFCLHIVGRSRICFF